MVIEGDIFLAFSDIMVFLPILKIFDEYKKVKYTEKLDGIIRIINMQEN